MFYTNIDLPEGFLLEEIRCDYQISEKMKKVWATELDLYRAFDFVCKEYDIKYFWAYGNLLGAARHEGFIPWDDDIDVFVPRADYEKLCSIANKAFKHPYFFQNEHTDPGSHIAFSKLRNSETAAILDFEKPYKYKYNQGIFLDIFPMDNIPDDPHELEKLRKRIKCLKSNTVKWARIFNSKEYYFGRKWVYCLIPILNLVKIIVKKFDIPNIPCRLYEKEMVKYNKNSTKNVSMMALGDVTVMPRECFAETVMLPFEFLQVPAPVGYIELLDRWYGDWHKYVMGAAGGSMHEGVEYDTANSYVEYLK